MSAPAMPTTHRRPARLRRLHTIPKATPHLQSGPGPALALGRDTRGRLAAAVRTLLDEPELKGAPDAVRLAVVVLAARTPSESGVVEIRVRELSRWLGLSESRVRHAVIPALRRSGIVQVATVQGEFGEDCGLACRVQPMWDARAAVGHALRLRRTELATLLRLVEALMAPGWSHRDGRVTPAGLLGARTGHGAATDRLALLLLVLQARQNGHVPLCGGRVRARYGRPTATLARLLGCSPSKAERTLARLKAAGVVQLPRKRTESGLQCASRLLLPAVAAAHSADREAEAARASASPAGGEGAAGGLADTAGPDTPPLRAQKPQVSSPHEANRPGRAEPAEAAGLHTAHASVAGAPVKGTARGGFSGSAVLGCRDRRERLHAREDLLPHAAAEPPAVVALTAPLRGEQPHHTPAPPEVPSPGRTRLTVVPRRRRHHQHPSHPLSLGDLQLQVALAPVSDLWPRLQRGQQRVVRRFAARAIDALAGIVGRETAPRALADRLTSRLAETGGAARVRDPMGWILGRGLVQRPACPDVRCDDGIRLDTGTACPTCDNIIQARRALRDRTAAQVIAEMTTSDPAARRAEMERRLREHSVLEAARAKQRRAQAARDNEGRRRAAAQRRAREEAAELARQQAPCADCGTPDCAGLCPACTHRRRTDTLVREAVDLAVAARADLTDAAAVAELTARCETDTRALLAKACRRACEPNADPALVAFTEPQVAQRIRDERRASALRRLMQSEEAIAEANAAFAAALRRGGRGAAEAAEEAGRRAAQCLLRQRLSDLEAVRRSAPAASNLRAIALGAVVEEPRKHPRGSVLLRRPSA